VNEGREEGVEVSGGSEADADGIDDEGAVEVLQNNGPAVVGDADGFHELHQVVANEDDVGAFAGNIGSGAHGNADGGFAEGGGVVDAVSQHGDHLPLPHLVGDEGGLLIGQQLCLAVCCVFLPCFSNGQSACPNPNPNPNPNPQSFANPGDFNGDCRSDILWTNSSTGQVYIWFMNGTAFTSSGSPGTVSSDWVIQGVGDFNGDGHADILWRNNATNQIYIWLMNGATIASSGSVNYVSSDWVIAGVGDFDGDGKADILWRDTVTGEVYLWLMNGTTIASSGSPGSVPWDWSVAGVGDFNGDGKADILWWNSSTSQVYLWLMNGATMTGGGSVSYMSPGWSIAGIGDFNKDGKSDILWWNSSTNQVYLWLMNGTTILPGGGGVSYVSGGWTIAGIGDFNGTGYADILWENASTGSLEVDDWLMNGTTITNSGNLGDVSTSWQIATPSEAPVSPTMIYSYSASYDNVGNVTASSDSTYDGGSIMGAWANTYDSLNRLSMSTWAPPLGPTEYFCWSYDAFGNRTDQMTTTGAGYANTPGNTCTPTSGATTIGNFWAYYTVDGTTNTGDNGKNQLMGDPLVTPLQYDAAGNVTYDGTNVYVYDGDGRLCAMQPISGSAAFGYLYDADGDRVAKGTINASAHPLTSPPSCDPTSNGFQLAEDYVLDTSGQELTMLNGSSNWQLTNVFGGGRLLATYDPNGLHFHVTDPLGTRRLQTSAVGQPETDIQSLPFGDQLNPYTALNAPTTADDATPLHFTGKERDQESGNDYFGARYYASTMGRFLSPDWAAAAEAVPTPTLRAPRRSICTPMWATIRYRAWILTGTFRSVGVGSKIVRNATIATEAAKQTPM
jgi:RHS repeat-associated protein